MRAATIDALLIVVVLAGWIGCVGVARLRAPLDRLHCAAFVNTACGVTLALAALVSDGLSVRAGKILLIVGVSLIGGAAASHAIGRALLLRGSAPDAAAEQAR